MKKLLILSMLLMIVGCSGDKSIKRIKSTHFNSAAARKASLDSLVSIIQSTTGPERKNAEVAFLAAFPGTWEQYKASYESTGLSTEQSHISVLGQLKFVDREMLFNKVIDYSINGKWGADFLQDYYLYEWFFFYGEELGNVLAKRNDKTIKSVFHFLFDGPHPSRMINGYRALHCKLTKGHKRLADLLKQAYAELRKREAADGHGH